MIKAGDVFKNIESGKTFTVKSADPGLIILGTQDGCHSMFVNPVGGIGIRILAFRRGGGQAKAEMRDRRNFIYFKCPFCYHFRDSLRSGFHREQ